MQPPPTVLAPVLAPELDRHALRSVAARFAATATIGQVPAGEERRWVQLAATDRYDAWLIAWPPGAAIDLHGHGGSAAAIAVVEGSLEERHLDFRTPHVVEHRRLVPGADTLLLAATHIHSVANIAEDEALSVHVYSPPLRAMSFVAADGSVQQTAVEPA